MSSIHNYKYFLKLRQSYYAVLMENIEISILILHFMSAVFSCVE